MRLKTHRIVALALAALTLAGVASADADVVTDANARTAEIVSRFPGTPPAVRMMAIVQVSVFEAVNAITGRYPALRTKITAAPGASVDAAVAAATRTALSKLFPAQQAAIDTEYQAALSRSPTVLRRRAASRSVSKRRQHVSPGSTTRSVSRMRIDLIPRRGSMSRRCFRPCRTGVSASRG
jgi:hypothetical protein